jgi:hypothetical protein
MIKNLIYFCYFKNSVISEYTLYNLKALNFYLHNFNGQKIVKIAVDDLTLDNTHLISLFDGFEYELVQNHPEHRESEYFIESIKQIKVKDSITFYAHNKGGTTDDYRDDTIKFWLSSMYFFNLEEKFQKVIKTQLLGDKTFSGILRKDINCSPWVCTDWHYSGTFFWFNTHKVLNTPNWDIIKKGRFSIEEYPGKICSLADSYSTFIQQPENYDSYSLGFWKNILSLDNLGENYYTLYNNFFKNTFNHEIN